MPQLTERFHHTQEQLYWNPTMGLSEDLHAIYGRGEIDVGWPTGAKRLFEEFAREHSAAFIGLMFGDEGKGRLVDDKIGQLLQIDGVKLVYVIRFQGGSNAGHTIESDQGKFAVHQIPSGILYPEAVGVMDRGMIIHPENLMIEIQDIEERVGDLRGKLFLSEEAILCTDLERAEEVFNRTLSGGRSAGGTSMGISPSYAHFYDRTGKQIKDFYNDDWRTTLGNRYDYYQRYFAAFGVDLKDIDIPDLRETRRLQKTVSRKVGTKEEFLDRFDATRKWFIDRDSTMGDRKMVTNTFILHGNLFNDIRVGIIAEGSQGIGINAWLGGRPDVTSSDTSAYGLMAGTGILRPQDIAERMGVFKITYTSKVPPREMATAIGLPTDIPQTPPNPKIEGAVKAWEDYIERNKHRLTPEQVRAIWIIMYAGEFGTTTGRLRGIQHLDLEVARYNARMGGIEVLGGTHLDVARVNEDGEAEPILVCTHYTDKNGKVVLYQPGLEYQRGIKPNYIVLPGWDGRKVQQAKSFDDLPLATKQFLTIIQRRIGVPIVVATTGPRREQLLAFPGYEYTTPSVNSN